VEVLGTIDAVGVMSARLETLDVDVPEKEGPVVVGIELDGLDRLHVVVWVEEKQLDGGGIPGEDREVHSFGIDGGAEWVGSAGLRLEGGQG
jgi:hypothetical protein